MSIDELIAKVAAYDPTARRGVAAARLRARRPAHEGQRRASGESYIEHPLAVAGILADLEMDRQTIAAALLHDVVEDTQRHERTRSPAQFGEEIAQLVDGVTKLTRIPYQSKEDAQVENLRKMFMAMAKDIRVIIIKLADRLHNMRTLASLPPAKADRRSRAKRSTSTRRSRTASESGRSSGRSKTSACATSIPTRIARSSSASRRRAASAKPTSQRRSTRLRERVRRR